MENQAAPVAPERAEAPEVFFRDGKPMESILFGSDGKQDRRPVNRINFEASVRAEVREKLADEMERRLGESNSSAASWLAKYRAAHRNFTQPIEFQGEDGSIVERHFVKRFSDSEIVEIGVLMARSGFSLFALEELEAQHAFNVALLAVGVCDESGGRFFGDAEEARLFYETPGDAGQISATLRASLLGLNPILAKKNSPKPSTPTAPNTSDG